MNLETIEGELTINGTTVYGNNAVQLKSIGDDYEDVVDLPISTYFPNGMFRINDVYDEITKTCAIQRIGSVNLTDTNIVTWSGSSTADTLTGNKSVFCKASFKNGIQFKQYENGELCNIIIPGYTATTSAQNATNMPKDTCMISTNKILFIHDSNHNAINPWRNDVLVNNLTLYYELPEPIITEFDTTIFLELRCEETPTLQPIYSGGNPHANYHSKIKKNKNGNT